jgi:hypothetical protein
VSASVPSIRIPGLQQVQAALVGGPRGEATPPRMLLGFEYLGSFSVNNLEAFCECACTEFKVSASVPSIRIPGVIRKSGESQLQIDNFK